MGGSNYEKNSKVDVTYVLTGKMKEVESVYVDGTLLSSDQFIVQVPSVADQALLTFKNDYLNTLSVGEHTFKITFKEGALAESKFRVSGTSSSETPTTPEEKPTTPEEKPTTPEEKPVIKETGSTSTGDTSSTMFYMSLIALSGCAVVYGLKKRKA